MWPFTKKNYASPYYGKGNRALFTSPPMIPQQTAGPIEKIETPKPVVASSPSVPDWEQRRYELMRMIVLQERRSVVLGKLRANDKQIAAKARSIADAAIQELQTHPFKSHEADEGTKTTDA